MTAKLKSASAKRQTAQNREKIWGNYEAKKALANYNKAPPLP
jgi:hypothetical protein